MWSGNIHVKKICTVAWLKVCKPYDARWLDTHSLSHMNESLLLQLSWKFSSSQEQWACFLLVEALEIPPQAACFLDAKVSSLIHNGSCHIPSCIEEKDPNLVDRITKVVLPKQPLVDKVVCQASKDGNLTARQAFQFLQEPYELLDWALVLCYKMISPSNSFVVWRNTHNKLPTDQTLMKRRCIVVSGCSLFKI
ncbi:unnamed protein product [Trifolium pratense]|uniref:Uncharacterized protein n=1 Tax=Trifolium pratense TaxID=57577 RepID=A0ACB0L6N1_TRIPR|nr:unnamed protein product [Trifolium pratense]